jgi:nucleotide-binding universal stress UspA family protein
MEIDAHTPDLVTVGVDGTPGSRAALDWAVQEALVHGRHLVLYHCWQPPILVAAAMAGAFPPVSSYQDTYAATRVTLDETMSRLRDRHPTLRATGALLEGPTGPRLTAHVRHDDLLILGRGTRHRIAARVLGSTVEYALRHARGTVVVVPPAAENGETGPFAGHVVAAIEPGATAGAIMGTAFMEAAAHGWPLAVVHAERPRHRLVHAAPSPTTAGPHALTGMVQSWHGRHPHVVVHRATIDGPPAAVLEHATAGARLLVVGRSSHPIALVRLTDLLLARTSCPIALTPAAPAVAEPEPVQAQLVAVES